METSKDFIRAIRARYNIKSDYAGSLIVTPTPAHASQVNVQHCILCQILRRWRQALAVALGLALFSTAQAADPWSTQDKVLETAYLTVTTIDCRQTLYMMKYPGGQDGTHQYSEGNPLLGSHPSKDTVYLACAAAMVAHVAVTHYLPARWRPYWQTAWIAIEAGAVANNVSIGVRIGF